MFAELDRKRMNFATNRKDLLTSAILYFDKCKGFEKIKRQLDDTTIKDQLVYSFNIDIDLGYLFEHDVLLGNSILQWPLESSSLLQEIIFHFCQSHNSLPHDVSSAQVFAHLKLMHFPSCGIQICNIADLMKYINYPGFVKLVGVVTGVSGLTKYTKCTKYICPLSGCPGHNGNHYIRMHISGALEAHIIRNDFRCIFCGELLEEVISFRNLADKMVVEIVPIHMLTTGKEEIIKNERIQSIAVFLRDEQVKSAELGELYEVIGICRVDINAENILISLEANNIKKVKPKLLINMSTCSSIVEKLHCVSSRSPWLWSLFLAHIFGVKIIPGGLMMKARLVLLISIVLNPEINSLHILSIGKEASLFYSLVAFAQKFASRYWPVTGTTPLTGKIEKDRYTWAPYFLQGGSLFMSSGGICFLGNICEWKKQKKEEIQTVMTTNKIFLDLPTKSSGGLSQQLTFPLKCHVWALYDSLGKDRMSANPKDVLSGQYYTGDLSKSLLDSFSYICFLDCGDPGTEEEIARDVSHHILSSHFLENNDDPYEISFQELDYFISLARQTETKMCHEAEELLQSYYRASRISRSSGFSGSNVPPTAIHTLISLAIGLAKLKLSTRVSVQDAVMAIYLYEEYLSSRFGQSCLNCQPQYNIPWSRLEDLLGNQNDLLMQNFSVQLFRFCSTIISSQRSQREE